MSGQVRRAGQGALAALALLAAFAAACLAGGGQARGAAAPLGPLAAAAAWLALTSLAQELAFRGVLLPLMAARLGALWAAGGVGLAFAAIHLGRPGESAAGLLGVFAFSWTLSAARLRFGGTGWAVGFHVAWNLMQALVLGLPDAGERAPVALVRLAPQGPAWLTGGAVGPEGAAPIILALALLARRLWPAAGAGR